MDTKVTTVIVNETKHGLTVKVGNRNCYVRLTGEKIGGEYKMQIDVNSTYQEFMVQDKSDNKVHINSDDCCDYKRITIKEVDDKFDVERDLRQQFRNGTSSMVLGDPAHFCKYIPCSYCGNDWPKFPSSDD